MCTINAYGTPKDLYKKLLLWYVVMKLINPSLFTLIKTNSKNRLEYYFMAIGIFIREFQHI